MDVAAMELRETLPEAPSVPSLPLSGNARFGRLLPLDPGDEPRWARLTWLAFAIIITIAYFLLIHTFFAPAPGNPGIDENAYLVAGKNIARHFTPGFRPAEPYAYVGPMWMLAKDGWFYPKYPFGVPALNAIGIRLTGNNSAAFYTSPVCAALSVLGVFFLTRAFAGSFLAILAMLLLATNPTLTQLALVPSSHAPAICFSLWGMCLLLYWWKSGRIWQGALGGFFLGAAVTMRYTEALLLFPLYAIDNPFPKGAFWYYAFYGVRYLPIGPLGLAVIASIRWTRWQSYLRAAIPILAWGIPVGGLVWFNLKTLGTLTGYDPTHESTGFTIAEFQRKWEYTIQQLHMYGLFMLLPIGVLGMLLMFARNWRLALFMVLWFVPAVLLYMAYYWGLQSPGVGFLRFFLTLYPPIIASAMWLVHSVGRGVRLRSNRDDQLTLRRGSVAVPIAAGIFVAGIAWAGVYVAIPSMDDAHLANTNMAFTAQAFLDRVPAAKYKKNQPTPLLFADDGGMFSRTLMHMQFAGDGDWYSTTALTAGGGRIGMIGRMGARPGMFGGRGGNPNDNNDDDTPVLFDPARREYIENVYKGKTDSVMAKEETRIIGGAIDAGRPVYAIMSPSSVSSFTRRLLSEGFKCEVISTWKEPAVRQPDPDADNNARNPFGFGRGGFGGAPGGRGGRGGFMPGRGGFGQDRGGLAPSRGMRFGMGSPSTFHVLQITRKPPTPPPAPTTRPATPATNPATPANNPAAPATTRSAT